MFKRCIVALVILLICIFIMLCIISFNQKNKIHRDPQVLMNKFYKLRKINPELAKKSLIIILAQDAKYKPALQELTLYYLQKNQNKDALPWLLILHNLNPHNQLQTYRLAYVYYQLGYWEQAQELFEELLKQKNSKFTQQINFILSTMQSYLPNYKLWSLQKKFTNNVLNSNIQTIQHLATVSICEETENHKVKCIPKNHALGNKFRQNVKKAMRAKPIYKLKAQGFAAIKQKHTMRAIYYLEKAYAISHDPELALQLGYLYACIHKNSTAYQYFQWATQSKNQASQLSAENAMTNLSGLQLKALPKPYFAETFFTPFSQSRFGLTVRPFLTRLGVEQNNKLKSREYIFLRRTDDNKSQSFGEISEIYEDDVQIEGMGVQITPLANIPIVGFLEGGIAYDLVYRNRDRWRGDLRTGFMYYNQFGVRPAYYDKPTLGLLYFSDLYADAVYYSRYNNNIIGGARTHQGFHLLQYHSFMLNAYVTGRVILDTKRLFL